MNNREIKSKIVVDANVYKCLVMGISNYLRKPEPKRLDYLKKVLEKSRKHEALSLDGVINSLNGRNKKVRRVNIYRYKKDGLLYNLIENRDGSLSARPYSRPNEPEFAVKSKADKKRFTLAGYLS